MNEAAEATSVATTEAVAPSPVDTKISDQVRRLEQEINFVLSPGSIKGAMKDANDGVGGKSRDLWQVSPTKLNVVPDLNPRVETKSYLAHIRALADSMKLHGFYQDKPLAGFVAKEEGEDVIYIYEGGSRLKAAKLAISEGAPFEEVPVTVDQKGKNFEDLLVQMVRGNTAQPLTSYEIALTAKRLIKFNWSEDKICEQLGIRRALFDDMMLLMSAPSEIRDMVAAEVIAFTLAVDLIKKHGAKALKYILKAQQKLEKTGKTRITNRHIEGAAFKKQLTKAAHPMFDALAKIKADPHFASLNAELQAQLLSILDPLEVAQNGASAGAEPDAEAETKGEDSAQELKAA